MERETAIAVAGLRRSYGEQEVLAGIELTVPRGTVFALLGPNGAGKSTTVHILSTLLRPDGGSARVLGYDVVAEAGAVRAAIGVTGQVSAVDGLLTGTENMRLMADLHHVGRTDGVRRCAALLERLDLTDAADRPASTYSGGMRRRLDLAMTLVGRPQVIFLDEPTTGLDPRSRRALWAIVRELVAQGVTIFLTTQYLEEADQLADRIAVLDGGRIVAEGTADELKRRVPGGHVRLRFDDAGELARAAAVFGEAAADPDALVLDVPGGGDVTALRTVLDRADRAGLAVADLTLHTPDLDDVFLALTGRRQEVPA
ncbi:daunorubicin resistance protein DrrA family ABC transporter ATP-binding protein [Pseudonocardia yuanmonensis]|uniref:Daunorubicin resistance protein DrrA family ABC transporter ATP-binding protein n=1 Tax=Pseudonocardia yuanmonensis TaxID=1095914 RepID=A0ABP8WQT9_9PSEU